MASPSARQNTIVDDLRETILFLKEARVQRRTLLLSACGALIVAVCSLPAVVLLFPLFRAVISGEYAQIAGLPILSVAVRSSPESFQSDASLLLLLISAIYISLVVRCVVSYYLTLATRRELLRAAHLLRLNIFRRYLQFGRRYFDQTESSRLVAYLTECASWIEQLLLGMQGLLTDLCIMAAFLAVMAVLSWKLTVVVILSFPLILFSSHWGRMRARAASASDSESRAAVRVEGARILSLSAVVQAFRKTEVESRRFLEAGMKHNTAALSRARLEALERPMVELAVVTSYLCIGWCVTLLHIPAKMPAAHLFVFFLLTSRLMPILSSFNRFRTTVARFSAPMAWYHDLFDDHEKHIVPSGPLEFSGAFKTIEIKNLAFSYDGKNPVLRGVSLTIPTGRSTGIIGPSGAGKTTLAHLLLRFYDCPPGSILIDGRDIRDYSVDSLRAQIGWVGQETTLFSDTIRNNLCYALEEPLSDAELEPTLRVVSLHEFVSKLPQGLDTAIGEGGVRISGGERQRIAIARALLSPAPILLFDEPTSALDLETEQRIAEAIESTQGGRTRLIITHRLSAVRRADSVAVLEKGECTAVGRYDDLAKANQHVQRAVNAEARMPLPNVQAR